MREGERQRELGDKTIQAQRDWLGFKQLTFAKTNLWSHGSCVNSCKSRVLSDLINFHHPSLLKIPPSLSFGTLETKLLVLEFLCDAQPRDEP